MEVESKVSVSVEEQIAAVLRGEQFNYVTREEALRRTLMVAQSTIAERDAEIAEMRKVTGPKCPKCGHWLKGEHWWSDAEGPFVPGGSGAEDIDCSECDCGFRVAELIANHPDIADELELTKEPSNAD